MKGRNGVGKTAKEMAWLTGSRKAYPAKYAKPPGYMKSQNGPVNIIKKGRRSEKSN